MYNDNIMNMLDVKLVLSRLKLQPAFPFATVCIWHVSEACHFQSLIIIFTLSVSTTGV